MPGKKLYNMDGIVYSTDANFTSGQNAEVRVTLPAGEQQLAVRIDSKHRGGKLVTLVQGFCGSEEDLARLGKQLKSFCGTGGSVKNNEIITQGDNRDKISLWLNKAGYTKVKKL